MVSKWSWGKKTVPTPLAVVIGPLPIHFPAAGHDPSPFYPFGVHFPSALLTYWPRYLHWRLFRHQRLRDFLTYPLPYLQGNLFYFTQLQWLVCICQYLTY